MNEVALRKLQHYCAYQERCHEEVRTKLLSLKVYGDALEEVMNKLIEDDFLNEERFAIAYAGGKFRMKQWGRSRILNELKLRKISPYCIKKAMSVISDEDYFSTIKKLIAAANKKYASAHPYETKNKVARYIISKGFEPELVWRFLQPDRD